MVILNNERKITLLLPEHLYNQEIFIITFGLVNKFPSFRNRKKKEAFQKNHQAQITEKSFQLYFY